MRKNREAGFSLIELLVAMVITLIIAGSVVGLLTGGQTAFKTQPERTDRQQNIRAAMDILMRDVSAAGIGMPVFMQVFARNLNNVGPAVAVVPSPAPSPDPVGPNTDQIMMISNTEGFDNEPACSYNGGAASNLFMLAGTTRVPANSPVLVIMTDGTWTIRYAVGVPGGSKGLGSTGACTGDFHVNLDFQSGAKDTSGFNMPGGLCQDNGYGNAYVGVDGVAKTSDDEVNGTCAVQEISMGDIIQYRVNNGADGVPNLERNVNSQGWQVLARGIEDFQIQYVRSDVAGTVDVQPAIVAANDYTTLTTQVRVLMSARGTPGKMQGASTATAGPMAIRASLTSQASPRMALWALTQESPTPLTPKWN